uniref:NADH dehydrogenase subunit 3 n=1 Tax=Pseudodiaptomus hessei TaxID=2919416 RepID=UPI002A7F3408|nr:NADH dehydrogenase subunit 3 [Pseudodiaptomus hessei]WOH21593.1 NADH dehydrogenase subunit 3 [Pseudodiaptomus hessei]
MLFLTCLLTSMILSVVVLGAGMSLSMKGELDREKSSPFECGFSPKLSSRLPFSMRFFLISIVFLIFDVEIVLLFPFISSISMSSMFFSSLFYIFFMFILLLGLYHEINEGSINWAS